VDQPGNALSCLRQCGHPLFIAHHITTHEVADSSLEAVRDDSIFDHLNPVIPNPALLGEESAFACALLKAKTDATCAYYGNGLRDTG
jgi:hypothetical protein